MLTQWLWAGFTFYLPAMTQNAGVYLLAIFCRKSQIPVDLNRSWKGDRLVGESRGMIGLPLALVLGTLVGWLQGRPLEGLHLAVGVDLGTVCSSFLKRRLGIPQGQNLVPLDQIDYILGASLIYWARFGLTWQIFFSGLIVGGVGHLVTNVAVRPVLEARLLETRPTSRDGIGS